MADKNFKAALIGGTERVKHVEVRYDADIKEWEYVPKEWQGQEYVTFTEQYLVIVHPDGKTIVEICEFTDGLERPITDYNTEICKHIAEATGLKTFLT